MSEVNEELLKDKIAGGVISSACSLAFPIALISTIVLVLSLVKIFQFYSVLFAILALVSFLLCVFDCLRLYLDSKLFKVLYEDIENTDAFDEGIKFLFNKNVEKRTLKDRWLGTKKLLKSSFCFLSLQTVLMIVLYVI